MFGFHTQVMLQAPYSTLILSWPADHIGWRLLVQTNGPTVGLSTNSDSWFVVPNAEFTNQVIVPLATRSSTAVFYRLVYP
jgi:hypothetical protein